MIMFVLCGFIYPFAVTALAQGLFHHKANGSLIEADGEAVGSALIGQAFTAPEYFWGVSHLLTIMFIRKRIRYQMEMAR